MFFLGFKTKIGHSENRNDKELWYFKLNVEFFNFALQLKCFGDNSTDQNSTPLLIKIEANTF